MALSEQQLLTQFINKHNNFYDYSKVVYKDTHTPVTIICPIHNDFEQRPSKHKKGQGCPKCAEQKRTDSKTLSHDTVIKQFQDQHGTKLFNYTKVVYKGVQEEVIIFCNTCNKDFNQTPDHHKRGSGCTHCAIEQNRYNTIDIYKNRPTTLYYIKVGSLYKIGLTMKSVKQRFYSDVKNGVDISIIKEWNFNNGATAFDLEQQILENNQDKQYKGKKILISGNTELLTTNILSQIETLVSF